MAVSATWSIKDDQNFEIIVKRNDENNDCDFDVQVDGVHTDSSVNIEKKSSWTKEISRTGEDIEVEINWTEWDEFDNPIDGDISLTLKEPQEEEG